MPFHDEPLLREELIVKSLGWREAALFILSIVGQVHPQMNISFVALPELEGDRGASRG
jgi:hypothetical protein